MTGNCHRGTHLAISTRIGGICRGREAENPKGVFQNFAATSTSCSNAVLSGAKKGSHLGTKKGREAERGDVDRRDWTRRARAGTHVTFERAGLPSEERQSEEERERQAAALSGPSCFLTSGGWCALERTAIRRRDGAPREFVHSLNCALKGGSHEDPLRESGDVSVEELA